MPRFTDLPPDFRCPYREGCPYLEGLPTGWVFRRYQQVNGTECHYEHQLKELHQQLAQERRQRQEVELENQRLRAQLRALHRRQFKGRRHPLLPPTSAGPPGQKKKRGAPQGHPAWQRPKPDHIDQFVPVSAPPACPFCQGTDLTPVSPTLQHLQEDILLAPRVRVTAFVHQQVHCATCGRDVHAPGPGELPGSYLGPATKATALYLRYQLHVSNRKISQFFADFFGLRFVPASAYGFERQAVRRGRPLYADLLDKVRSLPVAHADETSWRHDGHSYWVWYAGDDDLAAFLWQAHRSTEAAQELLGEKFDGVLVADAFASYNGVRPQDRQSCLAHIKTKAKELEQELALLQGRATDPAARQFCQNVQGFVRDACLAHRQLCRPPWRARAAKDQGQNWRHQLDQLCQTPLRHPRTETFRQRLAGPEQKLFFTCFRHPNVPPTNNQAERSLRPVVLMRKVVQGTRSQKGLENHTVLRSLFETARRQGRKPHQFFLDLLTQTTAQAQAALYRDRPARISKPPPIPQPRKPP
jgi:IS1 family transposase